MKSSVLRRCLPALAAALLTTALLAVPARADGGERRTVRVGYYTLSNFQEYDEAAGEYRGYSYDYLLAIAQYAGWQYEFVPVTYDEGLEMLADGRLDLMNDVQSTETLSQHLSFSALPSGTTCTCLVVSSGNTEVSYEDFQAIGELTVGLDYASALNSGFVDYCRDNDCMPDLIYYHTASGVEAAMTSGEIGACLVSDLQDVGLRVVAKFDRQSYYFAVTKGNSELLQELNVAMNSLKADDPYFEEEIYAKYHTKAAGDRTILSSAEKNFVAENPVIRVAYDPAWYPISYRTKDGGFAGAMASLFQLLGERTGLSFEYVCGDTYADALASVADGGAQIVAGFPYDYTWAARNGVRITTSFLSLNTFAACRSGAGGGTVAVPAGSYLPYLAGRIRQETFPCAAYADTGECLDAVLAGKADYALLDSYQMEYYRERYQYRNLSFRVANGEDYSLSLAVSADSDARLLSILGKALSSVGAEEIGSLFRETSMGTGSGSLLDALYASPQVMGLFFTLAGFILAILISVWVYTRKMRGKNRQLKAAMSAKSDFLSNMSHDMRTPLNGIIGYTELAIGAEEPAQVRDYLSKIRISGQFLLSLINDTLDISKIESGKLTLQPEPVDGKELLESITVAVRQAAQEKGVRFVVDTGGMAPGYILADRLNLQKIVLNLLSNAVKFTPAGGTVRLAVKSLDAPEGAPNTLLTVEDNGIGIGEEFQDELFEPFSQEHSPEAQTSVGTGLGLSIVKKIVDLMGGRIEVTSRRGFGSRFDVYLPLEHLKNYTPAPGSSPEDNRTLTGCRALLCEDNPMNREIAQRVLAGFGMSVTCAGDGQEGAALFADSPAGAFDVVLMDLRMPVMDGYSAARTIRTMERADAASVPILAMSADAYEEDLRRCREAGMNGHVSKPIDVSVLRRELLRYCGRPGGKA